jgi:hypothetical protein
MFNEKESVKLNLKLLLMVDSKINTIHEKLFRIELGISYSMLIEIYYVELNLHSCTVKLFIQTI